MTGSERPPRTPPVPLEPGGRTVDRELSWLAFNARVLQEARDRANPLHERLFFLSIVSSNLDEFFRVRVASLRSLLRLGKKKRKRLATDPRHLLAAIHETVHGQQETFGSVLRDEILPELAREGVELVHPGNVSPAEAELLESLVRDEIAPRVEARILARDDGPTPFLENRGLYLVAELGPAGSSAPWGRDPTWGLVRIPSPPLDRFVLLPAVDRHRVLFLDDVMRLHLSRFFPGRQVGEAWSVKLTRDAELHLEDEFDGDLVEAIRAALKKRPSGVPSRFLFDPRASFALVSFLREVLELEAEDLVEGGRYHNLHDLASFPRFGRDDLSWAPWPPHPHPTLDRVPSVLDAVARGDRLLHFPYQSFTHVVRFLTEAADDPAVEEIWLTVYRVSSSSPILRALLRAAEAGKRVRVFVEVQARFDEASNLEWLDRLEAAGIVTYASSPGIKVHAKIARVVRREGGDRRAYAYLGTGNFNESTARFYTDWGLLTADPRLTRDVATVFRHLAGEEPEPTFHHCLVAPFTLRRELEARIRREIEAARAGRPSRIVAKMNALEDPGMIALLQEAEAAGVPTDLVIRGICCLAPGTGSREDGSLRVRSILDRYLEHGRAYLFHADGEEALYLASADWMRRNLNRRVEVAFPLYDPGLRDQVKAYLELQLADTEKARIIDSRQTNAYVSRGGATPPVRSQAAIRTMVGELARQVRAAPPSSPSHVPASRDPGPP